MNSTSSAATARIVHSIWSKLRGPFLLPEIICMHSSTWQVDQLGWEVYDFQAAGCRTCGSMHVCGEGTCQCEKNDEGQDICCITGCCIKMLNFSDREFVDTVCFYNEIPPLPLPRAEASSSCVGEGAKKRQRVISALPPLPSVSSSSSSSSVGGGGGGVVASQSSSAAAPNVMRCSINKKNRYRSWVHSKMQMSRGNNNHAPSSLSNGVAAPSLSSVHQQQQMHQMQVQQQVQHQQHLEEETENIRSLIEMYVWDILCSGKWIESMKMEVSSITPCSVSNQWVGFCFFVSVCKKSQEKKVDAKKKMLMLKALKYLKCNRRSESDLVSIPEAVCMVFF
jgi:hypothetical protein